MMPFAGFKVSSRRAHCVSNTTPLPTPVRIANITATKRSIYKSNIYTYSTTATDIHHHLLRQHVVFPLNRALLQEGSQVLRDAAGLQEPVPAARLAAVLDPLCRDARAEAFEAGAGGMKLLQCVSGTVGIIAGFPWPTRRSELPIFVYNSFRQTVKHKKKQKIIDTL